MPVTISGLLSQVASSGNVTNLNNTLVRVLDDAILSSNAVVDTALYCKTLNVQSGAIFGASDSNGVTNRVVVYTYGNLQGWGGFGSIGYPGRAIVKFQGNCSLKNVTFVCKGGSGTEVLQASENWDGQPPYFDFSWGYDGSVFGDLDTPESSISIENVEILCPVEFASNTGFWDTGSELQIQAVSIDGFFVRNIYGVVFVANPAIAKNIKIINSAWGVVARQTNLTIAGLVSSNCAVQLNSIFTLKDSQVQVLRWKKQNNLLTGGFKFQRTFGFALQGEKISVKISCYYQLSLQFEGTTDSAGVIAEQVIEWGYISRGSAGKVDNENINATNNRLLYSELSPSKFASLKLPLDFLFSGYKVNKQWIRVAEINYTDPSILSPYQFLPVMVADTAISEPNPSAVASYAAIADLSQLYDALKLYSVSAPLFPSLGESVAWAEGTVLNIRNSNLIIDSNATLAIAVNQSTNTITIKGTTVISTAKFSSLKTTGSVTVSGGAIASFPYQDSSGISFKFFGLPPQARIWVRGANNFEAFYSASASGEAVANLPPGTYTARADAYLYYRSADVEFSASQFAMRLPLEPYRDKSGTIVSSISPNMAEVDLIRVNWVEQKVYFTYSSSHPIVSRDSLLYVLEKFQSGLNPLIPGSADEGLRSPRAIRYQNEEFVFEADTLLRLAGEPTNPINNRPYIRATLVHLGQESPRLLIDTNNGRGIDLPNGAVVLPQVQVSGGFSSSDRAALQAIPSAPLLSNDARLANLDAAISSRARPADVSVTVTGNFLEGDRQKLASIPSNPLTTSDARLNNLDAPISTRSVPGDLNVSLNGGFSAQDRAKLEAIPESIMSSLVETGWPLRKLLRLVGAVLGGLASGNPNNPRFRRLDNSRDAVAAEVDDEGNRTSINYELD